MLIPILFGILIVVCAVFTWLPFMSGWLQAIPIAIAGVAIILAVLLFGWWYLLFAFLLVLFTSLVMLLLGSWPWAIGMGLMVLLVLVGGSFMLKGVTNTKINSLMVYITPKTTETTPIVVETPIVIATATSVPTSVAFCDPTTIPFTDKGELDSTKVTTINGPAIYEWWTGGSNEGVQRVDVGHTITIHGAKGHWWTVPSQEGLDCVWHLHVTNYAAKPQHAGKTYDQLVVPPPAELLK